MAPTNKQRLVAAVLSPDDFQAAQEYCEAQKIGTTEMVHRALSLLLNRHIEAAPRGRRWPSKPSI